MAILNNLQAGLGTKAAQPAPPAARTADAPAPAAAPQAGAAPDADLAKLMQGIATKIGLPANWAAPEPKAGAAEAAESPIQKLLARPEGLVILLLGLLLGSKGAQAPQADGKGPDAGNTSPTPDANASATPEGGASPTPANSSTPAGGGSSTPAGGGKIFIIGDAMTSGGSSIASLYQQGKQVKGIMGERWDAEAETEIDKLMATGHPDLQTVVPDGQSAMVDSTGKLLGFVPTQQVIAEGSLNMADHAARPNVHATAGGQFQGKSVAATNLVSPIALDLDGSGKIETTGVSTAKNRNQHAGDKVGKTVSFDIDGDGHKDNVEWLHGGGDGMLVDDTDGGATKAAAGNGEIDGKRLFGDEGGKYANGYEKLAKRDTDHDGKLTGKELDGLKTWVDNGDAKVGKGELKTLAELGITEVDATMKTEKNARGEDLMRSGFQRNGKTQVAEDVWFAKKS